MAIVLALLTLATCKTKEGKDSAGAAPSSAPDLEPRLASRYHTPWGELGWQERIHNTIAFTNPGQTVFLRCAVTNSPVVHCRWSKQDKHDLSFWERGKAKLKYHDDHSLTGTWGHGDSDDDGGPCKLKPLPNR